MVYANIMVGVIILSLILTSVYFYSANTTLGETVRQLDQKLDEKQAEAEKIKNDNANLNQKLDVVTQQLEATTGELLKTKKDLTTANETIVKKQLELEKATGNLEETKKEFGQMKDELVDINKTLTDSIQWFKDNSQLPAIGSLEGKMRNLWFEGFLNNLNHDCIKDGVVNLGCINFAMGKTLSFKYVSEEVDRLYSITDIINREGGDCEDYSLFFKAVLATLKESSSYGKLTLQAWKPSSGSSYTIYGNPSEGQYWYIPDAVGIDIGEVKELTPYMICYTVTETAGHCIVALSKNKVTKNDDIALLKDAIAFEPQNGEYKGIIGKELQLCQKGDSEECNFKPGYISMVASENDLYQFKYRNWRGYANYKNTTEKLAEEITSTLNKAD